MNFSKIKEVPKKYGIRWQDASQTDVWWCIGYQPREYRVTADRSYRTRWVRVKTNSNSGY